MAAQALPKLTLAEARVLQDTENPVIHWRPDANIMDVGTQRVLNHIRLVPFERLPEDVHCAVVVPIEEYVEEQPPAKKPTKVLLIDDGRNAVKAIGDILKLTTGLNIGDIVEAVGDPKKEQARMTEVVEFCAPDSLP